MHERGQRVCRRQKKARLANQPGLEVLGEDA